METGGRRLARFGVLMLALLFTSATASSPCSRQCIPTLSDSIQFEAGKTYEYQVRIVNRAQAEFPNVDEDLRENLVGLECRALITAGQFCDLTMSLKQVKLQLDNNENRTNHFVEELQNPIRFSYQNGIVTDVCQNQAEELDSYALSVKKSIISALQTSPRLSVSGLLEAVETDVNGECETKFYVQQNSFTQIVVKKEKNLSKCKSPSDLAGQWLRANDDESMAKCEQIIEKKQIKSVQCLTDRKVPTLLPHFDMRVQSTVQLTLESVFDSLNEDDSILYEHHHHHLMASPLFANNHFHSMDTLSNGKHELTTLLSAICTNLNDNGGRVSMKTPYYVRLLARLLKRCSSEDVRSVWESSVTTLTTCGSESQKLKDIFVDTCSSVMDMNTAPVVLEELINRVEKRQLTKARTLAAKISLATNPSSEAVEKFLPGIISRIDDSHIILSLSTLIKKTAHNQRFSEEVYRLIVDKVQRRIESQTEETETVRLLSALGNVAFLDENIVSRIVSKNRFSDLVRITALKSMQNVHMSDSLREQLLRIFVNQSESNDVRVFAYKSLIHSQVTIEELESILRIIQRETQNQDLYNYVCSHQQNIRSSEDIRRRSLLPLEAPVFPQPAQAFGSRNYEWTYVNPKTSIGVSVEGDVIMGEESRVPRTILLNATLPVQNNRVHLVEMVIRQEGLEDSLMEVLAQLKQIAQNPAELFRKLSQLVNKSKQRSSRRMKLQVLCNVDDKNMFVWDSTEDMEYGTWSELIKRLSLRTDETSVIMPFKHRIPIQTGSGIPVMFEVNNTYILSMDTKFIEHGTAGSWWEMIWKPTFVAEMSVGLVADLGNSIEKDSNKQIHFVSHFTTAPTFHLKAAKENGRLIRLQMLFPEQEQTIARFETRFYKGSTLKESSFLSSKRPLKRDLQILPKQCLDSLDRLTGLTLCYQQTTTEHLRQSLQASDSTSKVLYRSHLQLVKRDPRMEGIEVKIELPEFNHSEQKNLKFVFSFDTPNSVESHRFGTEIHLRIPRQANEQLRLKVDLQTPESLYNASVNILNNPTEKSLQIEVLSENRRQFSLELYSKSRFEDNSNGALRLGLRVQPTPTFKLIDLEGEVTLATKANKKNIQVKLESEKKTVLQLNWIEDGSLLESSLYKHSSHFELNLLGRKIVNQVSMMKDSSIGSIKLTGVTDYSGFWSRSQEMNSIRYGFQYDGHRKSNEGQVKKMLQMSVNFSQFPELNTELHYNIKAIRDKSLNQELTLSVADAKQIRFYHQRITIRDPRVRDRVKREDSAQIDIEPLNVHYEAKFVRDYREGSRIPESASVSVQNREQQKLIQGEMEFKLETKNPLKYQMQGELRLLDSKYSIQFNEQMQQLSAGVYKCKGKLTLPKTDRKWILLEKILYNYELKTTRDLEEGESFLETLPWIYKSLEGEVMVEGERIQHTTRFELGNKLKIESETRKDGLNLLKCGLEYSTNRKVSAQIQYRNILNGEWKISRTESDLYHIDGAVRYEPQQVQHQIHIEWQKTGRSGFPLKRFEIKNHFHDKSLLDLYYKQEAEGHKVVISSRKTHVQLTCSEQKATLLFSSKRFGGIEHKTEVELNRKERLRLDSTTLRNGQMIGELSIDASLKSTRESKVKLNVAGEHRIEIRLRPWENFHGKYEIGSAWIHEAKFERIDRFHWILRTESINRRTQQTWKSEFEHECDKYSTGKVDCPLIEADLRLDTSSVKILVKGRQELAGFEHRTNVGLNPTGIEFESQTIKSSEKYAVIKGQIQKDWAFLALVIDPLDLQVAIEHNPQTQYLDIRCRKFKHRTERTRLDGAEVIKSNTVYRDSHSVLVEAKIDTRDRKHTIELKIKSDVDFLNMQLRAQKQCSQDGSCQLDGDLEYDVQKCKVTIQSSPGVVKGQLVILNRDQQSQNLEFEWHKPECHLQVNLFNTSGRQLDINIDLGKAVQKKFQIVSFIDWIPSVDIESAHGENSRIVAVVNFREEKMELSLNWFGQWKRDFEFEALFKCSSRQGIEVMVRSKHPANSDQIDARIKLRGRKYAIKWNRQFEDNRWTAKAEVEAGGEKKFELERTEKVSGANRRVIDYKAYLKDQAIVRLELEMNEDRLRKVNLDCLSEDQSKRFFSSKLYLNHRETDHSPIRTGLKVDYLEKTLFELIYSSQESNNGSLVQISLPTGIEYRVSSKVEHNQAGELSAMKLEWTRSDKSQEPIYKIQVNFSKIQKMKVARIEVYSPRFKSSNPKVIEVHYNLHSRKCHTGSGEARPRRCTTVTVITGTEDRVKLDFEYAHLLQGGHWNRTLRYVMATSTNRKEFEEKLNLFGHISCHSVGVEWKNRKSGLVYISTLPKAVDVLFKNGQIESKPETLVRIHFEPKDFWKSLQMDAKWDRESLRKWIVGEMPRIEHLVAGWRSVKLVRELNEEFDHGILRKFIADLFEPAREEFQEVAKRLESSEEEAVRIVGRLIKSTAEMLEKIIDSIELEKVFQESITELSQTYEHYKWLLLKESERKCEQSEWCRRLLNRISDYEIEKYLREKVVKKVEQVYEQNKEYIPQPLVDLATELMFPAQQRESNSPEVFKHGIRLLRMAQPVDTSNLLNNVGNIAQYMMGGKQDSNAQMNWRQMKGSFHDIALGVIDKFQPKTSNTSQRETSNTSQRETSSAPWDQFVFSPKQGEFEFFQPKNVKKPSGMVWSV